MSKIAIVDLEVFYHVGVPDEERAKPQRLLVSVELSLDFGPAAISDRLERSINYYDVAQDLLKFGEGRSWKLIEKLVTNIAETIMIKYKPQAVTVEVKKFPIPQARYVSASLTRTRPA
jgi:FolB domain-containing protein